MKPSSDYFKFMLAFALALLGGLEKPLPPPGDTRAAARVPPSDHPTRQHVNESYGRLPLRFEAAPVEADKRIKFLSRGDGYNLWLSSIEAVLQFEGTSLRMKLPGANASPTIEGLDALPGHSHYLIGSAPEKYRTQVTTYARVRYREVYPGIDLIFYGNQRQFEYDFVVAPGANPRAIRLAFEGAKQMRLDADGDLAIGVADGEVRGRKPIVYQEAGDARLPVEGRYVIERSGEVRFEIGAYDTDRPLVIDPVLAYSTYLGGGKDDIGFGIAVDAAGSAYVVGKTLSTNFPTASPLQSSNVNNRSDAFVAKLNPSGTALDYATYFGGGDGEVGMGIAVDAAGSAYVTGLTYSRDFPTRNPIQSALKDNQDVFVAKLNPAGSALVYSTFLGGGRDDAGIGIALDAAGNAYVTGMTLSQDFPTINAIQPTFGGAGRFSESDAFVTKVNAAGSAFVYSTYLGGRGDDLGIGIATDAAANVYLTGATSSSNFPIVQAIQSSIRGGLMLGVDAYVAKINPAGNALLYSTFLGGDGDDTGLAVAVDATGAAYLTGATASANFPTRNPLQPAFGGGNRFGLDAFVAKVEPAGTSLAYSTYLGGNGDELGFGIAVDAAGNAYIGGTTASTNFPSRLATQAGFGGAGPAWRSDAFVVKVNAAGQSLIYATCLGGAGDDYGWGLAVDSTGNAYLTGASASSNFPIRTPLQAALAGSSRELGDAMIVKIGPEAGGTTAATVSAASYKGPLLARESVASAFGTGMASTTQTAAATPLPTTLGGTTVTVRDISGTERLAPLFFVSPDQINYQVPAGTATGLAAVTIANANATVATGTLTVDAVAPGLFAANANGQGVAAAVALRVKADGSQVFEAVARLDTTLNPPQFVPVPINLGPESEQVFLILFGTGIRFRSALSAVSPMVGGLVLPVTFAQAQGTLVGLDQVNVRLDRSLIGRGDVDVELVVDGKTSNSVRINFR